MAAAEDIPPVHVCLLSRRKLLRIVLTDVFCSIAFRYVPPITSTSPNLPETPEEISTELRKQESLLSQIHSEMNAGFVNKKREEELWETQRIITQLKVSADLCNFLWHL